MFQLFNLLYSQYFFRQVLEVMAAARDEDKDSLAEIMFNNTSRLFFGA